MPTDLQRAVLLDRYALRKDGKPIETTWEEVALRVGRAVSQRDSPYAEKLFQDMLMGQHFIPGGRVLAAMGAPYEITAGNCWALPYPHDSRSGILERLGEWIEIQARGGGVGINMSSLRPQGSTVSGVNGTSSGPIAWMELFSTATHKVVQQGGSRRGAAMLILNDHHPDIFQFINAKRTPGVLLGANLSVAISDGLMTQIREDGLWDLHWGGDLFRVVPARELWDAIIKAAWASGEPGVVFLERINKESNMSFAEEIVTNPCSEVPLEAYGMCLLGSVNLPRHVSNGHLDVGQLHGTVRTAVRFLDNVIDLSYYPLPDYALREKITRRLGVGTMGLADTLVSCGLRYGSPEAVAFTEEVFREIKNAAYDASVSLAEERGPFPAFTKDYLSRPFIMALAPSLRRRIEEVGIRNCFLTSQAPTGTIAKLAGVWAGIEPYFARETYFANRLGQHSISAPDDPNLVTANEVTVSEHVEMMAAAQRHIDQAVSKTVNAPEGHSHEDTAEAYDLAYDRGLKSIAYYRDKSRETQVQWSTREDAEGAKHEWEECWTSECKV